MTRWKFSANVTGEESGTGLATAVSINNQPRLRCNAARFCIFSRNRAGKLWLLTLKHTPSPIFVCKITKQPRNSLPRNRRILLPTVFPLEFVARFIESSKRRGSWDFFASDWIGEILNREREWYVTGTEKFQEKLHHSETTVTHWRRPDAICGFFRDTSTRRWSARSKGSLRIETEAKWMQNAIRPRFLPRLIARARVHRPSIETVL